MSLAKKTAKPVICDYEIVRPMWCRDNQETALAEVTAKANQLIRGALAQAIGPLSVAPNRYPNEAFNGLYFTSQPLPAFGGASFWHNTGSSSADVPLQTLISELPRAALLFQNNRDRVAKIAEETRGLIDEIMAHDFDGQPPVRLIAVSVVPETKLDQFETVITLEFLGHGLTIGRDKIRVASTDMEKLREEIEKVLSHHARRIKLLNQHRKNRSRGLIDRTASRVIAAAGMELKFALQELDRQRFIEFRFDGGRMLGMLKWNECVVQGAVFEPQNEAYVWDGTFTCKQRFPEIISDSLIGQPLSKVVQRPYFPEDAIITNLEDVAEIGTRLDLKIPTEPISDGGA